MFGPLAGGHTSNFGAIWGIDVSVALIAFALSPSPFIPDIMGPMPNQSLDKAKLLPRITQAENGIGERSSELFDEDGVNAEEKQALESALYFFASPSKHVKTRNVGLSLSGERRRAEGCMNCFASVP
ncbi:MAG: hypothetical protein DMG86_15630 [Acidobacteria bacterium]|nr:MAG: hypothetical protein DMG86_15630 [Acidobacteriota bacterium]